MNYIRESTVAVSNATRWKLSRIVAATQPTGLDAKQTVDSLTEDILREWIKLNYPILNQLWKDREEINEKAARAVNEKKI